MTGEAYIYYPRLGLLAECSRALCPPLRTYAGDKAAGEVNRILKETAYLALPPLSGLDGRVILYTNNEKIALELLNKFKNIYILHKNSLNNILIKIYDVPEHILIGVILKIINYFYNIKI